jgi:VWFA-related protein
MKQRWTLLTGLACLTVCGLAPAADRSADRSADRPAAPPAFGEVVEVNVVNVDVQVTDRDGRPVGDLQRDDFEVFEDGKRVKVTNFERVKPEPSPEPAAGAASAGPGEPRSEVAPEERLHLIVYVDNFNLDPAHRTRVLEQVRGFLRDLRPADRVMLVTNDLGLNVRLPFTHDPAALEAALTAIEHLTAPGATAESERQTALRRVLEIREAMRMIEGPCGRSMVTPAESYADTTRQEVLRSIGAMTVLVNSLAGIPGRKALLYVSDGLPATPGEEVFQLLFELCAGGSNSGLTDVHDSELLALDSYKGREAPLDAQRYSVLQDLDRLTAHANANRVTLYTLQASGLRGNTAASAEHDQEVRMLQLPSIQAVQTANLQSSLTLLASETGGQAILNANDVTPDLRRMKEELGTFYSLGYVPEHSGDGRVHRIEVRLKRPGLQVRHRRSYRDKPALERAVDRTLAAVYHGFEDNPLEVVLKLGEQTPAQGDVDRFLVPITLRIPLFKLGIQPQQDRTYQGRLRLLVSTRDERGGVSPIRQIEVPLHIPEAQILYAMGQFYEYELTLTLPKGEQHVAIAVRDEATATTSVLSRTLRVGTAAAR